MREFSIQRLRHSLSVLPFVLFLSTAAYATDCEITSPAAEALRKMLSAPQGLRFEGTVLFERAGSRQFIVVSWPDAAGQGTMRRMNAAANPPLEKWPAPFTSAGRICDVLNVYSPSLGKGRIVAGRATQQLSLKPKDPLRLAYLVDLDAQTGMALAMVTAGSDGQVLERYEYADITFSEVGDWGATTLEAEPYSRGRIVVPGYFLVTEDPGKGIFVVSDGLATASVFVEPLPAGAPAGEGAVIEGATLTYTRGVASPKGRLLISVLGEVPVVTARLLADVVRPPRGGE